MKNWIINILTLITRFFIRISPPAVANNTKDDYLKKIDDYTNGYNSIFFRPKTAEHIELESFYEPIKNKIAIIIQGPIIEENNFTIETIRLYQKNYPNHIVIISTWNDISFSLKQQIESLNVELVLNTKPSCSGALNINFQIISSKNGILKAQELGCEFVYKTRTDQRFYATDISHYLLSILENNKLNTQLKYKLISSSMTTLKYRPYGIGDMFMFGHIKDMLLYWDSKLDDRNWIKDDIPRTTVLEVAKLRLAETGLCLNFLDKINYSYNFTINDSLKVYDNLFYIVDAELLNLFWFKYDWRNESRYRFYQQHTFELLQEKDTLVLSNRIKTNNVDKILSMNEGQQL